MINLKSIRAVSKSTFGDVFIKPSYGDYIFSNIPGTIKNLLGMKVTGKLPNDVLSDQKADQVVFLLLDSFGWKFWQKYKNEYAFLNRFEKHGMVSKLTSQFPSTTASHVTTIHSGRDVGISGVYEWFYYEPKLDRVIAPLLFSYAGDKNRNTLEGIIDPKELYPNETLYKDLRDNKISSYIFQHKNYTPSPFSNVVFEGATDVYPYRSLAHGLTLLSEKINSTGMKTYFYFYYDLLDTAGHNEGTESSIYEAEIHNLFTSLEDLFYQKLQNKKNITIIVSADHGMSKITPEKTYYINTEIPELLKYIKVNKDGKLIAPAGSSRDMFIYVYDDKIDEIIKILQNKLDKIAQVYKTEDLVSQGLFNIASDTLKARLGNIVILPYSGEAVWWYEKGKFEQNYYGQHGGLTPEEMEIPLLSLALK